MPVGIRPTARVPSSGRCSAWSRTRWRCGCSRASLQTGTRCASTRATASSCSNVEGLASRRLPENFFGEEIAARYDDETGGFEPDVLNPTVDFLAQLASGGAAL